MIEPIKTPADYADDLLDWIDTVAIPAEYIGRPFNFGNFLTRGQKAAWTRKSNLLNAACEQRGIDPDQFRAEYNWDGSD